MKRKKWNLKWVKHPTFGVTIVRAIRNRRLLETGRRLLRETGVKTAVNAIA